MPELLTRPCCRGMGSDAKVHNAAAIMREHKEDKQQRESRSWHHEEVSRSQLLHVILQECRLGLRGWIARANHVLGHCGFANVNAKFHEFAMDAWGAPARIGRAHLSNEVPNFARLAQSALAGSTLPGPVQTKSFAIPGK